MTDNKLPISHVNSFEMPGTDDDYSGPLLILQMKKAESSIIDDEYIVRMNAEFHSRELGESSCGVYTHGGSRPKLQEDTLVYGGKSIKDILGKHYRHVRIQVDLKKLISRFPDSGLREKNRHRMVVLPYSSEDELVNALVRDVNEKISSLEEKLQTK